MNPLISVIVPIYKVEAYLEKCVDSILAQTYQNLEVILIDDGSPDRCGAICDEYAARDPRIKVIHQENKGLSAARNEGLRICRGELVGFVDSDDWIALTMYEKLFAAMEENQADACRCQYVNVTDGKEEHQMFPFDRGGCSGRKMAEMIVTNEVAHVVWNTLWKREIFTPDSLFPVGRVHEDTGAVWKFFEKCETVWTIPDILIYHLVRPGSIVNAFSVKNFCDRFWAVKQLYQGMADREAAIQKEAGETCVYIAASDWTKLHKAPWRDVEEHREELQDMLRFVRDHKELRESWILPRRLTSFFLLRLNPLSIALGYWLDRAYRRWIDRKQKAR